MEVQRALLARHGSVYDFFFQAEDGMRDLTVTGVQTCALPISMPQLAAASLLIALVSGTLAWRLHPQNRVDVAPVAAADRRAADAGIQPRRDDDAADIDRKSVV